jgi:hypothetical protein
MGAAKGSKRSRRMKSDPSVEEPSPSNEDEPEEIVDYAATADELFSSFVDENEEGDDEESESLENDDGECDAQEDSSEEGTPKDESDDESVELDDDGAHDDASEEHREKQKIANAGNKVVIPGADEPCSFDLRNLLAISSYPIDSAQLYSNSPTAAVALQPPKNLIIPSTSPASMNVNEEYLLQKSIAACNQLISALWKLPMERSDAGPMALLPSHDDSNVPRSLVS